MGPAHRAAPVARLARRRASTPASPSTSARSSLDQLDFPDLVERMCRALGVPTERLVLELTEGATQPLIKLMDTLTRFRIKGIGLAIDDFGTGYSTLMQLRQLPFTELKIDRFFITDATTSKDSALIVKCMIDLAHGLGLTCTAEGVETAEQLAMLCELGCDVAQGYLIAQPARARRARGVARRMGGALADLRRGRSPPPPRRASVARPRHRRDPGIDRLVALGEAQADEVARRILLGERRQRHDRHPGLLDRQPARTPRRRARSPTRPGRRSGNRSPRSAAPRSPPPPAPRCIRSRARANALPHRRQPRVALGQPERHRRLQIGRRGEGQELVRPRRQRRQLGRRRDPADLPPGERKDLARRPALDRPRPPCRRARASGTKRLPVHQQMLPHLVADDDQVMRRAPRSPPPRVRRRRTAARSDCADC